MREKAEQADGCIVTVVGDYIAYKDGDMKTKIKKKYNIKVKVKSPEGALSVIKNKLLDRVLSKKYPDYCKYYTHEIVQITDLAGQSLKGYTNINLMNMNELAAYAEAKRLPIKLGIYTHVDTLRNMIFLAESNPKLFKLRQKRLEKEAVEERELAKLNPELFNFAKDEDETRTSDDAVVKQKKQMVYVPNKGYVDVKEYEENYREDFNKPDEAPYETYTGQEEDSEDEEEFSYLKDLDNVKTASELAEQL